MIELIKTYANGYDRPLQVLSFSIAENGTALLQTVTDGSIVISAQDDPDLWGQFIALSGEGG